MYSPASTSSPAGPALRGTVVRPGDPAYDDLRRTGNALLDPRPALIVRVAGDRDVADAIAYAREHGMPLAVRASGPAAGTAGTVPDGGLVIDLRRMRGVAVDARAMTARAGGGVAQGTLDLAAQANRLAVTGARMPDGAVAGAVLGTGGGWLERAMGLPGDALVNARVVTADGRIVTASAAEHPDLFWALRGGGGRVGVVTEVELRLMPLGPELVGGVRAYPLEAATDVLAAYAEALRAAPDALCGGVVLGTAPALPSLPPELHGRPIAAVVVLWAGPREAAQAGLRPLKALGRPLADLVRPVPYLTMQRLFDPGVPAPRRARRRWAQSGLLDDLDEQAIGSVTQLAAEMTRESAILLRPLGGAVARVAPGETAACDRGARWGYRLLSAWADPDEDACGIAWSRAAAAVLADHGPRHARAAATLERLGGVRRAWDPDGVFAATWATSAAPRPA
jgi:hypothetical protein